MNSIDSVNLYKSVTFSQQSIFPMCIAHHSRVSLPFNYLVCKRGRNLDHIMLCNVCSTNSLKILLNVKYIPFHNRTIFRHAIFFNLTVCKYIHTAVIKLKLRLLKHSTFLNSTQLNQNPISSLLCHHNGLPLWYLKHSVG